MNGIAVGDRVGIHRPTIPSNLERSRIIPEDRISTVVRLNHPWIYIETDSGFEQRRQSHTITVLSI